MKVGAIVLAAGGSNRFGRLGADPSAGRAKQLLVYKGETLVRRAARAGLSVRGPVVVVVGRDPEKIANELLGLPVTVVPNDHWENGIGGSLRCGLEALPACDAVVVLTCDQPRVDPEVIGRLVAAWQKSGKTVVASAYAGTLGVPALFGAKFFAALHSLPNDKGAKSIIATHPDEVVSVPFEEGALDIDTPADYERLKEGSFGSAHDG